MGGVFEGWLNTNRCRDRLDHVLSLQSSEFDCTQCAIMNWQTHCIQGYLNRGVHISTVMP